MSILKKLKNKLKKNYYRMVYQRSAKKQIESLDISVLKALLTKASKYLDKNDDFLKEINHRIQLITISENKKALDSWMHQQRLYNYYVERSSSSSSGSTDPAQSSR